MGISSLTMHDELALQAIKYSWLVMVMSVSELLPWDQTSLDELPSFLSWVMMILLVD